MKYIAILIVSSILLSLGAIAQSKPATWSVDSKLNKILSDNKVEMNLDVKLKEGWHTYGFSKMENSEGLGPQATEITIDSKDFSLLNKITGTKPIVAFDSSFGINVQKFKHKAQFKLLLQPKKGLKKGTYNFNVIVYYMVCTGMNCLPPEEIKIPVTVSWTETTTTDSTSETNDTNSTITTEQEIPTTPEKQVAQNGSPTKQGAEIENTKESKTDSNNGSDSGMLAFLFSAITLGAASWLMPCVYPMIPITVSFFTKRSEKEKTSPIVDSLVYSAGIMSTFVLFGVVVAIFFGAGSSSDIATNPWLNLGLAAVFVLIAFNLFGAYELALPASFVNSINKKSHESKGYSSSFLMGMVFSLTSFTCTVPFVSQTSTMAASGNWVQPIIAMIVYSAVFALPFFLLALFPALLTKIPRAGAWMNNIKVVFGFVELAFAVSYFARTDSTLSWDLVSREIVLAVWAGCSILIVMYVLGVFRLKLDSPLDHIGAPRATFALLFMALTVYMFGGLLGNSVGELEPFIYVESANKNRVSQVVNNSNPETAWQSEFKKALEIAKETNKPIFLDYTGVTCTNCQWMERNMFPKKSIAPKLEKFVKARLYTDRRTNPLDAFNKDMMLKNYGTIELPLYVLLKPDGSFIAKNTYTPNEEEFSTFLDKAIQ